MSLSTGMYYVYILLMFLILLPLVFPMNPPWENSYLDRMYDTDGSNYSFALSYIFICAWSFVWDKIS